MSPRSRARSMKRSRSAPCAGRRLTFPRARSWADATGRASRWARSLSLKAPSSAPTARATPSPPACSMGCTSNGRLQRPRARSCLRCGLDARGIDDGGRRDGRRVPGAGEAMGLSAAFALGACLLNPGEMGFEPLKPVGELDAANSRIRFDVRVEALRPSFVAPFPRWRSSAGCECGQGRGPPLGELQDIVGEADEAPLVGDLLDAAQEKLTEAARLLDLSEHRLGQLLS